MSGLLEVSVVISTRNRETRLAFALEALTQQTLASERFEVIVVRSADAVDQPLTRPPPELAVRPLVCPVGGTAVKRNLGWRTARAALVAFTDDDCRPSPEWLEALIAAQASASEILQGRTGPDPEEVHLLHGLAKTIRIEEPPSWYETCNIAYSRVLLEELDGFDEAYEFVGDDTDLGCRAEEAGATIRFVPDAIVWHAVYWRTLPNALRDAAKRSPLPVLVKRHPRQRERLWLGVFTDLDHLRLLLALGGLLMGRRAPLVTALATLPYLQRRVDPQRLTPWGMLRLPTQLGSRLLVDLVQISVFAISSLRYRSLLL